VRGLFRRTSARMFDAVGPCSHYSTVLYAFWVGFQSRAGPTPSGASPDGTLLRPLIGRKTPESDLSVLRTSPQAADRPPASSCLPKVKNFVLFPPLLSLYEDLDKSKLRFKNPSKFVFLCGGVISDATGARPVSLRDYLYRVRQIQSRLNGNLILAEAATQIYRDTDYTDLISFEEDIARIAAIVLVIPESPGSLAELGSFATNDTIRRALRVIIQDQYASSESFVRYGPIQRVIKTQGRDCIGVYPWRSNIDDHPIVRSIIPHYFAIVDFINDHLRRVHASVTFPCDNDLLLFYITYWLILPIQLRQAAQFERAGGERDRRRRT
jgi:hypothetical protein